MPRYALSPVQLLKDGEAVKVYYLNTTISPVQLDATKPVEALPVGETEDPTFVEAMDPSMLAIRQIDEFGSSQTLMLSPRMAASLSRVIDSFLVLGPTADNDEWRDGRN